MTYLRRAMRFLGRIGFFVLRAGMQELAITISGDNVNPGEAYLDDTPVLRPHAGTQPDLFLRWNDIPLAAASVDVAVHLHGFSQQGGEMPLAAKELAAVSTCRAASARPSLCSPAAIG